MRLFAPLLALLLFACAAGPDRRRVEVDVLWYSHGPRGPKGGLSTTEVRAERNDRGRMRVGIYEGGPLQAGEMWRATVWIAAFQAALALGLDPSRWVFSVETDSASGIDGPSGGGLLAAGMMAAVTGAPIRPEVALTGAINPDGTIGPVGSIPEKFRAAVAAGKRVLGYPLGQRRPVDLTPGGRDLDLEATFTSPTVSVHEVRDLRGAYALLTGRALPSRPAAPPAAMALPAPIDTTLARQTTTWLDLAHERAQVFAALGRRDPGFAPRWAAFEADAARVRALAADGRHAAAYWQASQLYAGADALLTLARLGQLVADRAYSALVPTLSGEAQRLADRLDAAVAMFRAAAARSPGDLMTLVDGLEAFAVALEGLEDAVAAHGRLAGPLATTVAALERGVVVNSPEVQRQLVDGLYAIAAPVGLADLNVTIATQNLAFRGPEGARPGPPGLARPALERLVALLSLAAHANLSYFEATTLAHYAEAHDLSVERVKATFPDPLYQHARRDPRVLEAVLTERLGAGSEALEMVKLSQAFARYIGAATLIAKYYSAGFQVDPSGAVVGVRRREAFETMLTLGEEKARENAAAAALATGEVPLAARIAWQIGEAYRHSDSLNDRVQALEQYWRASLLCQLVVLLRG